MIGLAGYVHVRRGEDKPLAGRWLTQGEPGGEYAFNVYLGADPHEAPISTLGSECLHVEAIDGGTQITLALTADDVARAQGHRRPVVDFLHFRLCRDGQPVSAGPFIVFPSSALVEAA